MDIVNHNSKAWDRQVELGNRWTIPVTTEEVEAARNGKASFLLTPNKAVPADWYGDVKGKKVLCLASGGGQQGPLFAALGAEVTVFDNSNSQLDRDRSVADRDGLQIKTVQGDMKDLSCFKDEQFDLIFHPVSNCFVDAVEPVWKESFRVLKRGGTLLAGFCNPVLFIFDMESWDNGELKVMRSIPYADVEQLPREQLDRRIAEGDTLEYGHSLESQINGQLAAGFYDRLL